MISLEWIGSHVVQECRQCKAEALATRWTKRKLIWFDELSPLKTTTKKNYKVKYLDEETRQRREGNQTKWMTENAARMR